MEDNSIDCCITDCPYKIIAWGVRIVDQWDECSGVLQKRVAVSDWTACSNKRLKKWEFDIPSAVKNWKMFAHNEIKFSDRLPELYRVMKLWTHTYIMINWRNLKELQVESEKVWFKYQNLLIRDKGNVTPNKYYMQWAEFVLMLRKWPAKNINNMGSSNLIRIPNIIWNKKHPTEKPVSLYEYLLLNSTNVWDVCIDPFMWCWPIVSACMNNDRKFIGIEIDEEYIDVAQARIDWCDIEVKEQTLFN